MDSRAVEFLMENVMFFVYIAIVFSSLLFFVSHQCSGAATAEQVHAKQIALAIDRMQPGMDIQIPLHDLYTKAKENSFNGNIVTITSEKNEVIIRVAPGEGYTYHFFSSYEVAWTLDSEKEVVVIEIV